MQELEIVFDPLPSDSLSRFITESLASYNISATAQESWYPVGFFLKRARAANGWAVCSATSGAAGCM
jgi:hypothetical protein